MIIGIDARMYGEKMATGIGQYVKRLTDQLFAIDHNNQYVLFLKEPAYSEFQVPNDRVRKHKVTSHWYTYSEQIKLPLELARVKVDLMHYPHFNSPILYQKKSVCTISEKRDACIKWISAFCICIKPAGFQYAADASSEIATNAPPMASALAPMPVVKNSAAYFSARK